MGDGERFHRAGNPDVKKPPLLIHCALGFRALVGEESILCTNEKNMRELKPLGGVERDEGEPRGVIFFILLALAVQ